MPFLHDLPDWDDERHHFPEDDEDDNKVLNRETTEACKAMYAQWQQVVYLLNGVLPDADAAEERATGPLGHIGAMIWEDIHVAAVKMRSSELVDYVGKMENAAIIRKCAQEVGLSLWSLQEFAEEGEEPLDEAHRKVIRAEIDKFRVLFREWVGSFKKKPDEWEDEWGLFV